VPYICNIYVYFCQYSFQWFPVRFYLCKKNCRSNTIATMAPIKHRIWQEFICHIFRVELLVINLWHSIMMTGIFTCCEPVIVLGCKIYALQQSRAWLWRSSLKWPVECGVGLCVYMVDRIQSSNEAWWARSVSQRQQRQPASKHQC